MAKRKEIKNRNKDHHHKHKLIVQVELFYVFKLIFHLEVVARKYDVPRRRIGPLFNKAYKAIRKGLPLSVIASIVEKIIEVLEQYIHR